ncbi:DMT family transporter [Holospora curviuscula]|uniref:EamA-like transporter family protein n=1 Tax=Holospora curviuscula TaxID=1082868 RepID=A0A2S5R7P1_9PROT|nr:DMT family transporter [Holospora curviuscula]PPE03334.1 EamA-like transporter family protein [Holospora curviuscula]
MAFKWAGQTQVRSSIFLCLWSLTFSLAMVMTKSLSKDIPQIVLMISRAAVGLLAMLPFWYPFSVKKVFHTPHIALLVLRGIFQTLAMVLGYAGYRYLPGETAAFLGTSGPFFILLLARLFLKESLDTAHWIVMIMAYGGVLCVLNPFDVRFSAYTLIPIFANVCMASSIIVTRKLVLVAEDKKRMLFANSFFPLIFFSLVGICITVSWKLNGFEWRYLATIGTLGALSAVFHFYALQRSSAAFVAIFDYFRLVVFLILNYFVYAEPMRTNAWIGGGIIVSATLIYVMLKQKQKRSA